MEQNYNLLETTVVVIVLCVSRTELGYAVSDLKIVTTRAKKHLRRSSMYTVCLIVIQGKFGCLGLLGEF